jgi:hypothetical protein
MEHMNLCVCSGLVYLCILLSCKQLVSRCDSQAACFGEIVNQDNYNKSLVFVIQEACLIWRNPVFFCLLMPSFVLALPTGLACFSNSFSFFLFYLRTQNIKKKKEKKKKKKGNLFHKNNHI